MKLPSLFPKIRLHLALTYRGQTVRLCETDTLTVTRLLLGRAGADWELPAEDTLVSHRHAELFLRRGRWYIRDLSSRNGVWLFGERITGEHPLAPGEVYVLGECRLAVSLPGPRTKSVTVDTCHRLQRLGGPHAGERIPLECFPAVIGTGPDCAVRLTDALASRRHAELLEQAPEEGAAQGIFLRDLGSTNGTTVNGVPQKSEMNARLLSDGDTLVFASEAFRFLDRAVRHEDPKAGFRRTGIIAGIFVLTLGAFALLRFFVWKDASSWLNQAETLGNACRFAEAAEALEKARHARGAEALADELEACAGRLDRWARQSKAWHAYASSWAAAVSETVPQVSAAVPEGEVQDWPGALGKARLAAHELERLSLADRTLRRLLRQQTPLSDADLVTLRSLPDLRLNVEALKAVGLNKGKVWLAAFRRSAQSASDAAAALLMLRETPPAELPKQIGTLAGTEPLSGALAAEAGRWRSLSVWVDGTLAAMPDRLNEALSGTEAALPVPPDLPESKSPLYVSFREALGERLRSASVLGKILRPVTQVWRGAAEDPAQARGRAEEIARAWLAPGSAKTPLLAFFAAPEADARRLLADWQMCRARAKALLDAVESIDGALAFIETQAPDSETARKIRQAASFLADADILRGELLAQPGAEARLTAFLLFPEICDVAARADFWTLRQGEQP